MTDSGIGRCRTCRYWSTAVTDFGGFQERPPEFVDKTGFGSCLCVRFVKGFYYGWNELGFDSLDRVVIESDQGWGFLTGAEFGCVHWKARVE
jgi:hypothetical protein